MKQWNNEAMKNKTVFLFDFDGVIADTFDIVHAGFNSFFRKEGLNLISKKETRALYMQNVYDSLKKRGVTAAMLSRYFDGISKYRKRKIKLFLCMPEVLERLSVFPMYIVTSASSESLKKILEKKKLIRFFKEVWGFEEGKSKIKKIKSILRKEKCVASQAYFVTDTVGDILESRKAEVKVIAVAWGYHAKKDLQKAKPDYLFDNPKDFIKAIPKL